MQKSGETLQEFQTDIAGLVRLSYPTAPADCLEQIATQTFIDGLRDPDTQQALRLARNKTLVGALGHALEFETAKHVSRMNARMNHVITDEPAKPAETKPLAEVLVEALHRFFDGRSSKYDDAAGRRLERRPGRGQPTCWSCGRKGHLNRDCRDHRRGRSPRQEPAVGEPRGCGEREF